MGVLGPAGVFAGRPARGARDRHEQLRLARANRQHGGQRQAHLDRHGHARPGLDPRDLGQRRQFRPGQPQLFIHGPRGMGRCHVARQRKVDQRVTAMVGEHDTRGQRGIGQRGGEPVGQQREAQALRDRGSLRRLGRRGRCRCRWRGRGRGGRRFGFRRRRRGAVWRSLAPHPSAREPQHQSAQSQNRRNAPCPWQPVRIAPGRRFGRGEGRAFRLGRSRSFGQGSWRFARDG